MRGRRRREINKRTRQVSGAQRALVVYSVPTWRAYGEVSLRAVGAAERSAEQYRFLRSERSRTRSAAEAPVLGAVANMDDIGSGQGVEILPGGVWGSGDNQ